MNSVYPYLIVNRIPIAGIGFSIMLLVVGLYRTSSEIIYASLFFAILIALFTIAIHRRENLRSKGLKANRVFRREILR